MDASRPRGIRCEAPSSVGGRLAGGSAPARSVPAVLLNPFCLSTASPRDAWRAQNGLPARSLPPPGRTYHPRSVRVPSTPERPTDGTGHRPHLDGMRAVAVYLVVAFHAGASRALGGFIGVDIFFVLSGFLVTGLLVRDLEGPTQTISWGRFYSRRVRRLLPAASVNLVVTAVVFAAVAAPIEASVARRGIQAAALYVSNWYFIGESTQYFGADIDASPVLQYWSLSVEEQFYLLWPLLLGGLWWAARQAGRHRALAVRTVIALAGLASLTAALYLATRNLERAYYGTDTRAYQLLAGAFLAVSPGIFARVRTSRMVRWLPAASIALVAALVVLSSSWVAVNPIGRGAVATVLTCGLIVSLDAARGGVGQAVLSWSPIAYLGRISYGTYLWHWLIIVVLARQAELSPLATAVLAATLATGLASLSYQVLENPIRVAGRLDHRRRAVIATGLALSLLVGLLVVPVTADRSSDRDETAITSAPGQSTVTGAVPSNAEVRTAYLARNDYGSCEVSGPVACPLTQGEGPSAIVVGESHAAMWTPMLIDLARRHDVSLSAGYLSYCPWTRGVEYLGVTAQCFADQADMFDRILPELDPDIVFLAHRAIDDVNDPLEIRDEDAGRLAGDDRLPALRRRITDVVADLRAGGRTVVMFEPVPVAAPDQDPLTCLSDASSVVECRFVTSRLPGGEEKVMRDLAEVDDQVVSLDLDALVCPYLPICDPVVDGRIVRSDTNHLTTTFASSLLDSVEEELVHQGVLKPA